ncbi:spindle pole body component Spc98p [Diutina catenulata]
MDPSQMTRVYLNRLVNSMVPREYGEAYMASVVDDITADLARTPATNFYDLKYVMAQVKTWFVSTGRAAEFQQFQQMVSELARHKPEEEVARWVVFLTALRADQGSTGTRDRSPSMATTQGWPSAQSQHSSLSKRAVLNFLPNQGSRPGSTRPKSVVRPHSPSRSPQSSFRPLSYGGGGNLGGGNLGGGNSGGFGQRGSFSGGSQYGYGPGSHFSTPQFATQTPFQPQYAPFDVGKPPAKLIEPVYQSLPEEHVLTYIQYTLLGLDSKLVKFESDIQVSVPDHMNASYSQLMASVLECALLYKHLSLYVRTHKGKMDSPIKTAFLAMVEMQLNTYVTHINGLFDQSTSSPPSTLIGVYNNVFSWIYSMRLLYNLVLQLEENGYVFLSRVYDLSRFGDERIRTLATQVFQEIVAPYYDILEHWTIKGNLIDEAGEFFISFKSDTKVFNEVIEYHSEMVPEFIPQSVGKQIYQIGKMLIFISTYCKQLQWISTYSQKYTLLIRHHYPGLQFMSVNDISEVVTSQYKELRQKLTVLIQGPPNNMFAHITNFKRFYLMQQGDFYDSIMEKGAPVFDNKSVALSANSLGKVLSDSINYTSVKNNQYRQRLDICVLDSHYGNTGWEVLFIEYRISDLPLVYLLESQMEKYREMTLFLWRLRSIGFMLNRHFVNQSNAHRAHRRAGHPRWLTRGISAVNAMRFTMAQFVTALTGYLSLDVIEASFDRIIVKNFFKSAISNAHPELANFNPTFLQSMGVSPQSQHYEEIAHNMNELTIDEIINLHTEYLNAITTTKLMSGTVRGKISGDILQAQVEGVLNVILMFVHTSEEFFTLLATASARVDAEAAEHELRQMYVRLMDLFREYNTLYEQLIKDMRADFDLREVSKIF